MKIFDFIFNKSKAAGFGGSQGWDEVAPQNRIKCGNAETAAKVSAVFYCVSIIAETVGSLPFEIKSTTGDENHPWSEVLAYRPNPLQTGVEFWSQMAFTALLRGIVYAEPVFSNGELELWHLNPLQVQEKHEERKFGIEYQCDGGTSRLLGPADVFWFAGLGGTTLAPIVPWEQAKSSAEFAIALEEQGKNFFKNAARPSGFLTSDVDLSDAARERISKAFSSSFGSALNAGKTPILERLKWVSPSQSNTDSQYIELCRKQVIELARYWRIPISMISDSAGKSNQEQEALQYVKYTIRPLVKRIEQAIYTRLMTPDMRGQFKAKFNLDGLLRGDSTTQWRNAVLARTASVMSRNDIATHWFGLPKIDEDWADDPREPLNSNRAADTFTGGQTAPQDQNSE